MIYQIKEVVKDVKVCIDQNKDSAPLLLQEDIDTLSLEEIIESKIVEATRRVHLEAPNYMLDGGNNFGGQDNIDEVMDNDDASVKELVDDYNYGDAVYWEDDNRGWVLLSDDFMRLVVFEMSDWERAVYTAISTDDPQYELQRSRFKGLRGNPQRPVCAIGIRPEGRVLEFYSCKSRDAEVKRAVYIPEPEVDSRGFIMICRNCYTAVVYTTAALVLTTLGDASGAQALMENAKAVMV